MLGEAKALYSLYPCVAALVVWLAFLLVLVIGYRAASNAINEVLVLESSIYDRHIIMRIAHVCYSGIVPVDSK